MSNEDALIEIEFPLQQLINELNMFDRRVNEAVILSMHKAGSMIEEEQKRLVPESHKELRRDIRKSGLYVTKKGAIGITSGYQKEAFILYPNGFNAGIVGTMLEFGRPGQSPGHTGTTMKQVRNGEKVEINKGKIDPVPHIRRGFDNVKEQAVQMVIDSVMSELGKIFNE